MRRLREIFLVIFFNLRIYFSGKNLKSNWTIKLSCLALAFLLYFNLQNSKILEKEIRIPVVYPSLPTNYIYEKDTEKFVTVRLRGLENNIDFYSSFIKAYIKTSDLKVDNGEFRVGSFYISISHFTEVPNDLQLSPQNKVIRIVIEEKIKKSIPVEVGFVNQMPNTEVKHSISPRRVSVHGVKSELKKIKKITLPNISLKNKTETFNKTLKLPSLPGNLFYSNNVNTVNVFILITQTETENLDNDLTQQVENQEKNSEAKYVFLTLPVECSIEDPAYDINFSKNEVEVTLKYTYIESNLALMDYIKDSVKAQINCFYLGEDSSTGPIKSKFARVNIQSKIQELETIEIKPKEIEIFYSKKPEQEPLDFSQELIKNNKSSL